MVWWKRYEPILEAKPVSGTQAIADLIAQELCDLYSAFPPADSDVAWDDAALQRRFAGRMHELPKLDVALVNMLARIVVLDLAHEIDAVDHLFRNNHHRVAAPTPAHNDALLLLWRIVAEHLAQRAEDTRGLLKRADQSAIMQRSAELFARRHARIFLA